MNESFPDFTPQACKLWERVPAHIRPELLENVFCGDCRGETTIVNFQGKLKQGMLVLEGSCQRCGSSVARVIEESFRTLKHGLAVRPIYHFKPERIQAHIGLCYLAFALTRHAQQRIKLAQGAMSLERIRAVLHSVQASIL